MHGWYGYGPQAFGFPWGMAIFMIILVLLLGFAITLAIRALRRQGGVEGNSAMGILIERFAKGELSKEQFIEMRDLIEKRKK